jgi:hypothetical protein
MPADRFAVRPQVTQRSFHHRTHGAQGAFRGCGIWEGLRRLYTAYIYIGGRTRAEDDFGTRQGCGSHHERQGKKFGLALRSKAERRRVTALGHAALAKSTMERAESYRAHIEWALRQPGMDGRMITFGGAAKILNERGIESVMGGRWRSHQLRRIALRLGLRHPLGRVPIEEARVKVLALWRRQPELSVPQVITTLRLEHYLGKTRAYPLVKECRAIAARRSPMHRHVGWRLDCWTAARIRISEIWKRHPELSAKQILLRLGPKNPVRVKWIQHVTHECAWASAKPSAKRYRIGRQFCRGWRHHRSGGDKR